MTHLVAALVTLAISGRTNATPSVAAVNQFVAVAWGATLSGHGTDVYVAVSRDGGRTFRSPVRVNDVEGSASLGLEQPPRVSVVAQATREPLVVVVWSAKTKDGTRLLVARSKEGGLSFTPNVPVTGSEAAGNRGWASTTVDRRGHVVAVWLDHREMASGHMHSTGTSTSDGAAHAQASKLYFADANDPASALALVGGVCYCCKTAVAAGPDGSIYAAWRHVYPGDVRDIALISSHDGGRSFTAPSRVSADGWRLAGCPENGPALTVAADNTIHVLWPTLVPPAGTDGEPSLALFHAVTRDGHTFSPREQIATDGTPRHPQLVATALGLAAAWDEETAGGNRRVIFVRSLNQKREVMSGTRSQTPALAAAGGGVVVVWAEGSEGSVIRVAQR